MKVVVTVEARFFITPDNRVWCDNQFNFPHSFWQRYLAVFEEVEIMARVAPAAQKDPSWREVTGERVTVSVLPYYIGPWQYLKKFFALRKAIKAVAKPQQAYILRVGSPLADLLRPHLLRHSLPYAVEVVGDPWDMYGPGGIKHPLRPIFRYWFRYQLRQNCRFACASSYVTERLLQERYPSPLAQVSISASSIVLGDDAIAAEGRDYKKLGSKIRLITVGTLEHPYKGTDLLIEAVALLVRKGKDIELSVLGDGRMRTDFESLARERGIQDRVHFLGTVPGGPAVREVVGRHDIFVLPSRSDGMPRAMIEAMALGLFCIGTRVGGMLELLESRWLVPVNSSELLAAKISEAIERPEEMNQAVALTLQKARGYHQRILEERRIAMYQATKKIASEAQWK